MESINKKYPRVSLIDIIYNHNSNEWIKFLTKCHVNNDVEMLKRTLYGIQYDMSELAKQKLNTNEISTMFLRLQKSLQDTARKIYRKIYPMPQDKGKGKQYLNFIDVKRNRDKAFQEWLRDSSF